MISAKKEESNGVDGLSKEEIPIDNNRNLILKKRLLYEAGADAVCEFGNGELIRVNKSLLAFYSPFFNDIFFGESPTTTVKIEDFDCKSFRTFLDCLFGLKEYTVLDALLIYPIAHRYDVEKCLKKCAKLLIPDKTDENVCLTLNLATFYRDWKLKDNVVSYLVTVGAFVLLVNDSYRNLLEPLVISHIIPKIEMDSFLWKKIYEWGDFYLKKQSKPDNTIRLLFEENDILSKLSLKDFESASSILDFHDFSNKELLDSDDILNFLKYNTIKNKNLPDEGLWINVKKGDKIVENIKFIRPIRVSKEKERIHISTNRIYFEKFENVLCNVIHTYKWTSSISTNPLSRSTKCKEMLEEGIFKKNEKKFYFSFDCVKNEFDIFGAEITYGFSGDCTILKTSLNKKFESEELCFTKDVESD